MQNSEELDLQALEEVERELKKNMADEDDKEKEEATDKVASAHKKEMSEPQIPTQNSEDLYVEELERVEEELKKKKKADNETKAYSEQPPESPPRRMVAEEARWSPKTPVTEMPSFDLGISPWVSWNSPLVTGIITIPEKNFNTPSSHQIIDLTMMEREPAKYQMIVSPQVTANL
uniref:neurofilament medium polypeptide-like n=1 Tax=Fragaria vesca subsp. vesca TaxID=101020 RepID=UPI0005CA5DAE|nr:PREDICTED: neurofilament medium polypeptide-like [Fragaria vesca subsp. vesca]